MEFAKNKNLIMPIKKSTSNRNLYTIPVKRPNRASSLKPSLSKATTPIDHLPPLKATIDIKNYRLHPSRQTRKPSKNGFDQRILSSKTANTRKCTIVSTKIEGMSKQALFQRKQSHLNAYFNQRKNKLKQITTQNKKIYVRINSQKSLYSSRELNKSYESVSSLSRRLSQSKMSKSSSKNSLQSARQSKLRVKKNPQSKKKIEIKIESHNINKLQTNHIHRYLSIFCNNVKIKPTFKQKNMGKQPLVFVKDKQNKKPQTGDLQRIVEQYNQKHKRKALVRLQ